MADIKISEMLGASLPLSGNEIVPILQFDENRTIQTKNLRALLSASGDINFDDSTGVISFTERTDSEVRGLVSATGDLSYDSGTGEFSVTTYKSGDFDTDFGNKSTDNLSEGATNLYYTDLRSRSSLSATGDLSYDSATGTISFTERTDQEVRDLFSATGDLSYDSATGTISFTERTDAQVRELLSASGDLSYDSGTGEFSFTERTDSEVRGLLSASGDLSYDSGTGEFSVTTYSDADVQTKLGSVSGNIVPDTTEVYDLGTSTLRFRDLYLSGTTVDLAGTKISSNENGDIEIRDAQNNPSKITAAGIDIGTGADRITISRDPITGGLAVADAATGASASVEADISANTTDDLTEGTSNLYYTDTRVRGAVSAGGDLSYDSGTGEFLFTERTDQEVRGLVSATGDLSYDSGTGEFSFTERTDQEVRGLVSATGDLSYDSGTGEFSFTERTDQEVRDLISASGDLLYTSSTGEFSITTYKSADFDTDFGSKSTDDLSEGTTNLYYTDSRVDSHLTGGNGVTYSTGEISIGQSVATSDSVTFAGVGVSGLTSLQQTTEVLNTKFAPSGVVDHDFSTGAIWYHLNVSSDFTANFTNVPTTDNRATNVVLVLNNSPGVGIPNAVQIDGVSQTINWADATVPEGTAEQTDIVSFTLIRQNSSWLVTGSLNTFG